MKQRLTLESPNQPIVKKSVFIYAFILILMGTLFVPGLLSFVRRAFTNMATEYIPGTHSMAFVTVPNKETGTKLAKGLIEKKLAACVNIIPGITSVYEWEGEIAEDSEMLMMIKTRTSRIEELTKFVRENHPYDVAEVITSPIDAGNPPYLKWLSDTIPEKGK